MFYASYPDSELIISESKMRPANEFINMSRRTTIRDYGSYTQSGSYMSPFHDILSLFNTVDNESELSIQFTIRLNKNKSILDRIIHITKHVLLGEDKKTESTNTNTVLQTISTLIPDLWIRIGCSIHSNNIIVKQSLREQFLMLMK